VEVVEKDMWTPILWQLYTAVSCQSYKHCSGKSLLGVEEMEGEAATSVGEVEEATITEHPLHNAHGQTQLAEGGVEGRAEEVEVPSLPRSPAGSWRWMTTQPQPKDPNDVAVTTLQGGKYSHGTRVCLASGWTLSSPTMGSAVPQ
jgi:hypothetical protein